MVLESQVYPGDKTPSTSVENIAEYFPYNHTPFKDDTVDVIELLFAECPVVLEFRKFIKGLILRESGVKIKLHCTDIMFGVQRLNVQTYYINKVILIAKMCISS